MTSRHTSRRAVLAGAAALSALAAPASIAAATGSPNEPVEIDPIFEVIEAHRRALAQEARCCRAADVLRDEYMPSGAEAALDEAQTLEYGALVDLLNVEPTTLAGVAAVLRYVAELSPDGILERDITDGSGDDVRFAIALLADTAATLEALAVQS
jgi:hypothetical protein